MNFWSKWVLSVLFFGLVACNPTSSLPSAPSSLSAQSTSAPAVVVKWGAATGAKSYVLERKTSTSGFTAITLPNPTATEYSDTAVNFNTTYTYQVKAANEAGTSTALAYTVTTPPEPTRAPASPTAVSASLETFNVRVSWQAPSSGNVANYKLQRKAGSAAYSDLATTFQTNYLDATVSAGVSYTYRVSASNDIGDSNPTESNVVTTPAPGALSPIQVLAAALSPSSIRVNWTPSSQASSTTRYTVERRMAGDIQYTPVTTDASGSSYTDTAIPNSGRTYTYRVKVTGDGAGLESNAVPVPDACASRTGNSTSTAASRGCFGPVYNWQLVPTFSALLPNGKVIGWYASDDTGKYREHVAGHNQTPRDAPPSYEDGTYIQLWDPAMGGDSRAFTDVSFGNRRNQQNIEGLSKGSDLFCAGFNVMSDGKFFTAGGNMGMLYGSIRTNIFDPITNLWTVGPDTTVPDMWKDRWYPTLTKMSDGRILITGGTAMHDDTYTDGKADPNCRTPTGVCPTGLEKGVPGGLQLGINSPNNPNADKVNEIAFNNSFEIYNPATGRISMLNSNASRIPSFEHYYPWWFVAPNGFMFLAGAGKDKAYLDVNADRWSNVWSTTSIGLNDAHRVYGSSVMYEPGKIMLFGGGYTAEDWSTGTGRIISLNNKTYGKRTIHIALKANFNDMPTIVAGPDMADSRTHANSTLMADGRVFVNGGQEDSDSVNLNADPTSPTGYSLPRNTDPNLDPFYKTVNPLTVWNTDLAVYRSEIWTPSTSGAGTFSAGAVAAKPRMYHSVAMLLPDGTVWTAAGGGCGYCVDRETYDIPAAAFGSDHGRPDKINQKSHEIYYPPYLFNSDGSLAERPIIQSTSATVTDNYPTVGYNTQFTINWAHTASSRTIRKVTLVALGAPTHAFNENQRFLELPIVSQTSTSLTVRAPYNGQYSAPQARYAAPPGFYMIFIIDSQNVPSVAKIVRIG